MLYLIMDLSFLFAISDSVVNMTSGTLSIDFEHGMTTC